MDQDSLALPWSLQTCLDIRHEYWPTGIRPPSKAGLPDSSPVVASEVRGSWRDDSCSLIESCHSLVFIHGDTSCVDTASATARLLVSRTSVGCSSRPRKEVNHLLVAAHDLLLGKSPKRGKRLPDRRPLAETWTAYRPGCAAAVPGFVGLRCRSGG